jgi:acetyl/propionyl-CoA carboxylase alpha subunit
MASALIVSPEAASMTKMTFIGKLDNEEHLITVEDSEESPHIFNVELGGHVYRIDAYTMPSEIVNVLIDNKSYDLDLEKTNPHDSLDGRLGVRVRGRVIYLEMLDERRKKMKDAQMTRFSESGLMRIVSPMPGKVLRVLVSPGEVVKEGDGLVVVEAMKMENELRAPRDGTVKEIVAKAGESVDSSALLLTIE